MFRALIPAGPMGSSIVVATTNPRVVLWSLVVNLSYWVAIQAAMRVLANGIQHMNPSLTGAAQTASQKAGQPPHNACSMVDRSGIADV